jgi:hypothetical protein
MNNKIIKILKKEKIAPNKNEDRDFYLVHQRIPSHEHQSITHHYLPNVTQVSNIR